MASDLMKLSKTDAVKAAENMRRRAMRYKKNAEKLSERLVNIAIGTGTGFLMGYIMGGKEKEFDKLVAASGLEEEAYIKEGKEDPRKLMGMDYDLVISVALVGVSLTNMLGSKVSPLLESAAFGGLAGWAYNAGSEMALKAEEEEAA